MKSIRERFEETLVAGGYLIPNHLRIQLLNDLEADVKAWLFDAIKKDVNP
jgi:hypothetical protein